MAGAWLKRLLTKQPATTCYLNEKFQLLHSEICCKQKKPIIRTLLTFCVRERNIETATAFCDLQNAMKQQRNQEGNISKMPFMSGKK